MKLALIQFHSTPGDAAANRRRAEKAICQAAANGADLIVLPETWNLGFFPKDRLQELAEVEGGESRSMLQTLAEELCVHIAGGSLVTRKGGQVYNTAYVFDREGKLAAEYDKIHLFSPSGENQFFRAGSAPCTVVLDGMKIGLIICYDMRFGELCRLLALDGAELLLVPAQWPGVRLEHWRVLARARAIENQQFVACVNGCGEAFGSLSGGHTMLLSPLGELIAGAGGGETTVYSEIDRDSLADVRRRMDIYRDRRPELYRAYAAERGLQ